MTFRNAEESHAHSLEILNLLYEYDDFMESVGTVVDLGCGFGLDLEWWATRTTRDDDPRPLNICCFGVDQVTASPVIKQHSNVTFQCSNFETTQWIPKKTRFDVLWSHDAFQYVTKPLDTLKIWRDAANSDAMLIMTVPETVIINRRMVSYTQPSGCYYHHSVVSLMHMLAVTGWDCASGFFRRRTGTPWIDLAVYKSPDDPVDPVTTTWYDLAEKNLIPKSAQDSVNRYGFVRQEDLVLPWLDKSLTWFGNQ
jgi:hypothetical protein